MNCGYSKQILALYVEDDLPPHSVAGVESHLAKCLACRDYCNALQTSQSFIKSRFRAATGQSVSQETLAHVRRAVMARVGAAEQSLGWTLRLERLLFLGLRNPRYAAVAFTVVAVVSVSLLGQMRHSALNGNRAAAAFGAENVLFCPADYREWVLFGSCQGQQKVYINPAAYQEYTHAGTFPEDTVMVREASSGLEVIVKDSNRFEGRWGYYEFEENGGKLSRIAQASTQTAACIGCHRDKGLATQF